MESRRDFIRKSLLLSGAAGCAMVIPPSIQRAMAINPDNDSTYLDAEHVVLLMLENRSFDHCFGTLQGVRGFNDPRAVTLPDGNPVWLQSNAAKETYAPFRLNIHDTKSTWMGCLPHSRGPQVDAYNKGKYDKWLDAKRSPHKKYADMPLTLGFYNREDLPFNYAMADAFTVCDQNFSSGMTSTHPNRLYYWTGTIRDPKDPKSMAYIRNPDLKTGKEPWVTFPERLEENGVSWKIYQNDLACGGGFKANERDWLSNYNCNPMEFFPRYNVQFSGRYIKGLQKQVQTLPGEISDLQQKLPTAASGSKALTKLQTAIRKKQAVLDHAKKELDQWSITNFEKLSRKQKNLYRKAFTINNADPDYHSLESIDYLAGNEERNIEVPKGDLLYQFREDVRQGKLPMVSWLVAPHYLSDHPTMPMYGPWYISEILDILTKNPAVWKKTIFMVTYDENDGYYDHIPPFTSPDLSRAHPGKCSAGIDPVAEYIHLEDELAMGISKKAARGGPIGLGYRVPMLIASPWSRGGKVCSQVFDHTSTLQFLEHFLNKKLGLNIQEENISAWRRTVCGDLTAAFRPYRKEQKDSLSFLERDAFIKALYDAKNKPEPSGYHKFTKEEVAQIKANPVNAPYLARQEQGIRPSSGLPYELYVDGGLNKEGKAFEIQMTADNKRFGKQAAGAPFSIYAMDTYREEDGTEERMTNWQYAVSAGDSLSDSWPLERFKNNAYNLAVYGPNGFFRQFKGDAKDPSIAIRCRFDPAKDAGNAKSAGVSITLIFSVVAGQQFTVEISDLGYQHNNMVQDISEKVNKVTLPLEKSFGWYDFEIKIKGHPNYSKRYCGRIETGKDGFSDPLMGRVTS